jgi:DNA-binding NtrC family response regulator
MPGQRPTLVANDAALADELLAYLKQHLQQLAAHYPYDACREHISWHKRGVLMLVVTGSEDLEAATRLVQEAALRKSTLSIALIEAASSLLGEGLTRLRPHVSATLSWPEDAAALAGHLEPFRGVLTDAGESPADMFASRLLCQTPSLLPLASRLALAAAHDVTVLLTGETGTGKTYLARLLHEYSPRRHHPFLMVPCGAQPTELFESTFFGHVKGAFTSAHQGKVGKFAAAGKGTILLDEIDLLGPEQQASLLRVIETGEYELVGSNETLRSQARLIVASNVELEEAIEKGKFRQDLFYRLNVMAFHLPPLRERVLDIPLLASGFVAHFNAKFGKDLVEIDPQTMALLTSFPWPGNMRQLENAMQQAVLVSNGPRLTLAELPEALRKYAAQGSCRAAAPTHKGMTRQGDFYLRDQVEYERRLILEALEACKFNRSRAAKNLGISRVTLHKKIKQYGLTDHRSS